MIDHGKWWMGNDDRDPLDVPFPSDGMSKFRPTPEGACDPGAPVRDVTHLVSGDPCCSSCRRVIALIDHVWVHAVVE